MLGRDRLLKERTGHPRVDVDVAANGRMDRLDDLRLLGPLDHVAGGAGAQRFVHHALVLVHGEEQHEELRVPLLQAQRRLDAVLRGHRDIEQDDVGLQALGQAQRLRAVARLADDLEVGVGQEQGPEAGADHRVVVSDQDADRQSAPPPRWWSPPRGRSPPSTSHPGPRPVPRGRGGPGDRRADGPVPARTRRHCPRPSR